MIICGLIPVACNRSNAMAGPYVLASQTEQGCDAGGVRSSHLVLRLDGTYDQIHQLTNGSEVRDMHKRWSYDGSTVHLNNFRVVVVTGMPQLTQAGVDANLVAIRSRPRAILLPNSNCFYGGPK